MRIRIDMTIEVDEEDWSLEYAMYPGDVRADVKQYVRQLVEGGSVIPLKVVTWR